MRNAETYSTWVEIDLQAIENNIRWFTQRTGVQVMAVVKANAYGHGAVESAFAAQRGGANWLGVARVEEAVTLRKSGIGCPILLLGFTPPERLVEAIDANISLAVWDIPQILRIEAASKQAGKPAHIHLKVDTGMSRLGVQAEQALPVARRLGEADSLFFEGIFTHFARADEANKEPTLKQEGLFLQTLSELAAAGLKPPFIHASNSAASLGRQDPAFNLIRTGIAMYGLHPSLDCPLPDEFRPALVWKSTLSLVKVLPPGRGISYGHTYTTRGHERIGTVPVGYADGFRRIGGNEVLVAGMKVPVVGRVCMDQVIVQLDEAPEAEAGDEVVIIGFQGDERISAEDVAKRWGTINYEVVCGINFRVPRIFG
jgi:alanine racemase